MVFLNSKEKGETNIGQWLHYKYSKKGGGGRVYLSKRAPICFRTEYRLRHFVVNI